jgi:hypothetical protein
MPSVARDFRYSTDSWLFVFADASSDLAPYHRVMCGIQRLTGKRRHVCAGGAQKRGDTSALYGEMINSMPQVPCVARRARAGSCQCFQCATSLMSLINFKSWDLMRPFFW